MPRVSHLPPSPAPTDSRCSRILTEFCLRRLTTLLARKGSVDGTSYSEGYAIMKIGIVGAGRVGCACALAAVVRGSARDIVIVDRTRKRAKAVATDLLYGSPLCPKTTIVDGDYDDLAEAELVMITAGINEKDGGATDRSDPRGRLRLLEKN